MSKLANEENRNWASQAVERFVGRFDESYRKLAYHAALPLVLTPELVNYLRNEFLREERVPWVAEVDLLLSDLCSQVGYELYAMDTHVRAYLLEQMEQDPNFGVPRMQEVAQVLISYVNYLKKLNPERRKQEIEAQRLAAMVYMGDEECKAAAKEIADRLKEISSDNSSGKNLSRSDIRAELARLTRITDELSRPLREQKSLLRYARLVQQVLKHPEQVNTEELRDSYSVEGVELRFTDKFLPEPLAKTLTASRVTVTQFERFPPIQIVTFDVATYLESEFEICTFQVATIEKGLSTGKNIKWLFQSNPKKYRILDAIRDFEEIYWEITCYFQEMAVEDLVLLWVAGKKAGIYAIAEIIELSEKSKEVPPIDYWIDKSRLNDKRRNKPKACIRFVAKLLKNKPLLKEKFTQDDILKNSSIIRVPQNSCFKVKPEESKRIHELIKGLDSIVKTETKEAKYYTEELGDGVGLDMISIPGGSFMMGSPEEEGYDSEKPQHQVTIEPFFMGKFQVTQAQWQAVMGNNPAKFQDNPLNPVEQVSWDDAQEFCDRLSKLTGKKYRLPTETEWEYACRAGTDTPFHFGETISTELANYDGNDIYGEGVEGEYRQKTTPVGYFKVANNFGLYDMHGNVWEWCEDDWHDNYQNAPTDGTAWLSKKSNLKVARGGSWFYNPVYCRSAYRDFNARGSRDIDIGFRVVCVAGRTT